ncbi:alpha-L-fucosidase 2 [Pedobacter antarcticus]|uniref:Alpha-L-fucosidase 2 n=2 Tax=Pedobacter antarcticus TaxID=34086 RepID=A0A1I2AJ57_9SPHI|nr:glycoside hydrolase family 95 protein [Pedobacter antarcticus]SFE43936.1 alpha-L-fucosidase 2 [Pedobacter antarcticus]
MHNSIRNKGMVFTIFISLTISVSAQNTDLKLWYNAPAENVWEAALPVGNGRLGAMVFGNPGQEQISLNEASIWSGGPNRNDNPEALNALPEIRKLIFEGQYQQASKMAAQHIQSKRINGMMYQPAGDFRLVFPGHENYAGYYRELDLESAVAKTTYKVGNITYTRTVFSSVPDQAIIIHLTADKPGSLTFEASLLSEHNSKVIVAKDNILYLSAQSSDKDGVKGAVKFETGVGIKQKGGTISSDNGNLKVSGASSATVYISIATNFVNYKDISADEKTKNAAYLHAVMQKSYRRLSKDHITAYQKYFNRVQINLGKTPSAGLPTDQRVAEFAKGNDPQLAALYYQFGRYLLISSSQPGGQPANLQGIWNNKMNPPWGSKYTININTEMNYWPAEESNLSEMHGPLIEMVKELSETGKETARVMYGAAGWVTHHNTDLWRISGPVDAINYGMWPMGGAWLSRHLFEKYLYNGDREYLKTVYPALKGAAQFYLDFLVEEPVKGWMVVSPSMSPENSPKSHQEISIAAGTTMDNQLVFDLFTNTIRAAEALNTDVVLIDKLKKMRMRLPPMQVGQYGQLQEWIQDLDNPNDKHRHVSHLFGLYPAGQISPYHTPQLFEAAKNSMIQRGDVSTGWSMGWKVNLWARLQDGNHAYKLITNQLTPAGVNQGENSGGGTYPNLFDAHPPFQIDGNFGCTAGITEMLMQSHDEAIHLLPALPDAWKDGSISGLRARGGFEIERLVWKDGHLYEVVIKSTLGGKCRLRVPNQIKGRKLAVAAGNNPNPFFQSLEVKPAIISATAGLRPAEIKDTLLYEVDTKPGKTYKFKISQ